MGPRPRAPAGGAGRAVALAASGRAVNGVTLANTGHYSRGTASPTDSPWRRLVAALSADSQTPVDLLLGNAADGPDPARLAADLAARDRSIADLRSQLSTAASALQPLADHTHDLAVELRDYRDEERASLAAKSCRSDSSTDAQQDHRLGRTGTMIRRDTTTFRPWNSK